MIDVCINYCIYYTFILFALYDKYTLSMIKVLVIVKYSRDFFFNKKILNN